jgi:PAS domain S-box-containing protein
MEIDIPVDFFREAWQYNDYPQAAVDLDSRFLHVNHAFERLLGYSSSELRGRTWMEVTRKEHVGGDLQSVQDVISGRIPSYEMEKDYIHKRGHYVSIVLRVARFPMASHESIGLFRVEAPIATATRPEIHDVESHVLQAVRDLRQQVNQYQKGVSVQVGDNTNTSTGGDYVGRDKNSTKVLMWGVIGLIAMAMALVSGLYYLTFIANDYETPPEAPPQVTLPVAE